MHLRARAVEVIVIAVGGKSAEDVAGIGGVAGMNRVAVGASVRMPLERMLRGRMRCRRSFMRSRVG
jgi:hypothetical protein